MERGGGEIGRGGLQKPLMKGGGGTPNRTASCLVYDSFTQANNLTRHCTDVYSTRGATGTAFLCWEVTEMMMMMMMKRVD